MYNGDLLFTGFGYDGVTIDEPIMTIYFEESTFDVSSVDDFTVLLSEKEVQTEVLYRVTNVTESTSSLIELYPNPAQNEVTINGLSGEYSYQVVDILGAVVITGNGSSNETMNVSNLAKGVYVVVIQQGDYVINKKLVID